MLNIPIITHEIFSNMQKKPLLQTQNGTNYPHFLLSYDM